MARQNSRKWQSVSQMLGTASSSLHFVGTKAVRGIFHDICPGLQRVNARNRNLSRCCRKHTSLQRPRRCPQACLLTPRQARLLIRAGASLRALRRGSPLCPYVSELASAVWKQRRAAVPVRKQLCRRALAGTRRGRWTTAASCKSSGATLGRRIKVSEAMLVLGLHRQQTKRGAPGWLCSEVTAFGPQPFYHRMAEMHTVHAPPQALRLALGSVSLQNLAGAAPVCCDRPSCALMLLMLRRRPKLAPRSSVSHGRLRCVPLHFTASFC